MLNGSKSSKWAMCGSRGTAVRKAPPPGGGGRNTDPDAGVTQGNLAASESGG